MKGDKGRQVNLSTQASRLGDNGRQLKGDKGRQTNPSRARHPGWETNEGDKGRQMHPSTQRAVPGIQAGRERETNEGDKGGQMNPSTQTGSSRLGDNGRQMSEPRETNERRGDNGRQMKGDTGRQMNPSTQRAVPGIQARAWQQASHLK